MRVKLGISIWFLGLMCFMHPGTLWADTIYTYTGNPFTSCLGDYFCNGATPAIDLNFTVAAGTELNNLTQYDIKNSITSFNIADSNLVNIYSTDTTLYSSFFISTDNNGNILYWDIAVTRIAGSYSWIASTSSIIDRSFRANSAIGQYGEGYNNINAGHWVRNDGGGTPVPEPSTMLLLGGGLAGLAFWKRKKSV